MRRITRSTSNLFETLEARRLLSASLTPIAKPWVDANIGAVGKSGTAGVDASGNTVVSGGGADVWGAADAFNFDYQPLAGDGTIVARLTAETNSDGWAKSGVMIRTDLSTGSAFAYLFVSPQHGISFQARSTAKATPSSQSVDLLGARYLKLVRTGQQVAGYYSSDGASWTAEGKVTLPAGATAYAGLAVCAHNNAALCTATFNDVSVTATTTTPSTPSGLTDGDIGAAGVKGSASQSAGTVSVSGSGTDIFGDTDIFNFDSESFVGNGTIVARMLSASGNNSNAKAGIMFRETNAADSRFVDLVITPAKTIGFQYRTATHNSSAYVSAAAGAGTYLRLTRSGSKFTGAYSADGVTWKALGSVSIPMVNNVRAGLCVCSHSNSTLTTAKFDHLAVTADGGTASIWSDGATPFLSRWEGESVTYNNKLYIFGGFDVRDLESTAEVDVYDPAADKWSYVTSIPTGPLSHAGAAVVGNTLYLVGGDKGAFKYGKTITATSQALTYNFTTNTWGSIKSTPIPVSCGGLVGINNVLYYYGGLNTNDTADVSATYAFDLNNPSAGWVTKAAMPDARNHLGYAAINGIAYAIGGQHLYDESGGNDAEVDTYNPVTNKWTKVAALPQKWSSFHVSTFVVNNKIAFLGGQTNGGYDGVYQNGIEEYDPATNKWTSMGTIPEANEGLGAAYINGELIGTGGTVDNIGGWATQQTWITKDIKL